MSGRTLALRAAAVAALLVLVPGATRPPESAERLAAELRRLYEPPSHPGERWRRRGSVRLADGRELPREQAFRDHPDFVAAAARLVASGRGDDAPLGAWLLGTLPAERRAAGEPVLRDALRHRDPLAAFEAALALSAEPSPPALESLRAAAASASSPETRVAAAWAAGDLRAARVERSALAPGFRRGVSWWMSESGADAGAASFRRLASLGVEWVSLHTWDPLQRGLDEPVLASPGRRHGFRDLAALVRSAHAAGLRVMVKPHLEMRGREPSGEERRVLGGPDGPERRALLARLSAERETGEHLQHNRIAMRSEADWSEWMRQYEGYVVPYAREAQAAGADAFCVGRELDSTVVAREADWRRLVARLRTEFRGPLTYSANFDTWQGVRLWDALDWIGVSAYFPLSASGDPTRAELEAGWQRALAPLVRASRAFGRPVVLTEAGFPSLATAARAPWREERRPADVWLQARCYEATLRALARHPEVEGAFFWLWERAAQPPFRDPSHTIAGKPAAFAMARVYAAR